MPMTEDLTVFFDQATFASSATHTPLGGAASEPASVIFDANGLVIPEMDVQTTGPTALVPSSQWAVSADDTITINAVAYIVRSAMPLDDGAITLLTLAEP